MQEVYGEREVAITRVSKIVDNLIGGNYNTTFKTVACDRSQAGIPLCMHSSVMS